MKPRDGAEREPSEAPPDDVTASGVRVERGERETTPAPPDTSNEWASFPSARPTSVPDYDVAAVAFATSLRHPALPKLPADVAIPTRTSLRPPADLELRASFVLLHVDDRSSVRDIAMLTTIPSDEVLAALLVLTAAGLVEMGGTQGVLAAPISGARSRPENKQGE